MITTNEPTLLGFSHVIMSADILASLTEVQRQAASHIDGPLLMIAGPGSGKTRVVTHRIAYMISQGVNPHNILALTFTNKAAQEMRLRIERLVSTPGYWMGTFHGFCARLLRQHGNLVGLAENFTILDSKDSKQALKRAIDAANIQLTHTSADSIAWEISNAKSNLLTPEEYQTSSANSYSALTDVTRKTYPAYEQYLLRSNSVDFDDLLLHVAVILRDNPELRAQLDDRYRYIMVDEYQDTNLAQYAIVRALCLNNQNLSVTGDPDQSIYAWRGANISNIREFEKDYPSAKIVHLEQNYRSTGKILSAADELIAHNRHRKPKKLFTENAAGESVRLVCFGHPNDEAAAIAQRIAAEVKRGERDYKNFAIFFRVNAFSRPLERALRSQNPKIPFQIVRGLEFLKRKEVKDIIAYLHLVNNPANNVAFERIVNMPPRGIGKTTLDHLRNHAERYQLTMLEACREAGMIETLSKRAAAAISRFVTLIDVFTTSVHLPLGDLVIEIVDNCGFTNYLEKIDAKTGEDRSANVDELINEAREFQKNFDEDKAENAEQNDENSAIMENQTDLESFLEQVALVSEVDGFDQDTNKVLMMSLHAAKGLEFPSVFIVGVEHGILPHERSMDDDASLEEERRLLFVGITRAEQQLQISYCQRRTFRGQTRIASPSQFLHELPRNDMQCTLPAGGLASIGNQPNSDFEPTADYFENSDQSGHDALAAEEIETKLQQAQSILEQVDGTNSQQHASPIDHLADKLASMTNITTASDLLASTDSESSNNNTANKIALADFKQGMLVAHQRYGSGVIVSISGSGDKRTATIKFLDQQQRKFRLAFAPLMYMDT
jgi:DNA helicase-2/ATP-dependent DNA helicase PcrA